MDSIALPRFRPFPLFRGGHAQTIIGAYLPSQQIYKAVRREVTLSDGDRLVLHDNCPPDWQEGDRVALLIHGLGGSHRSGYMVRIAAKLSARGVRTFRQDLRGFGAGFDTARGHSHAGKSEDLAAALEYVTELCDQSPIALVGFSMGGNILLKFLGELGEMTPRALQSAIAIAPPIDLTLCSNNLRRSLSRLYDWSFMKSLFRMVQRRRRAVKDLVDIRLRPMPRNLKEFDDQYVAPLAGYSGAQEYYTRCSSAPLLKNICVPTRIISAEDDPVVPAKMFENIPLSPSIDLQITAHGGHLGFIGVGGVDPDCRWIDWRVVEWMTQNGRSTSFKSTLNSKPTRAKTGV